ncbi:S1 family peptidase [Actinoplanes sp. GCM10030250]|uniref:S1 family peptidase n=1 Tax=Actinoplanes sp. GCM10030250 TaxID=3273376 RepID=UPI0036207BD8
MRRGLAVLAITVTLVLGLSSAAQAIANGEPVPDGKYRFSVKLTMTGIPTAAGGKRNSACSGALVSAEWVITAGHCFRDANGVRVEYPVADLTTATVGRTDLTNTTTGHEVKIVEVHQSPTADVSLARLETPIRDIRPIKLAKRPPVVGQVLRLTGYGSTTSVNPAPEPRLRTGKLQIVSMSDSVIGLSGHSPQPDTTPCPYDSGGPFFIESKHARPTLVALVSNGPSCPHAQVENAARTDNLSPWIQETTH